MPLLTYWFICVKSPKWTDNIHNISSWKYSFLLPQRDQNHQPLIDCNGWEIQILHWSLRVIVVEVDSIITPCFLNASLLPTDLWPRYNDHWVNTYTISGLTCNSNDTFYSLSGDLDTLLKEPPSLAVIFWFWISALKGISSTFQNLIVWTLSICSW